MKKHVSAYHSVKQTSLTVSYSWIRNRVAYSLRSDRKFPRILQISRRFTQIFSRKNNVIHFKHFFLKIQKHDFWFFHSCTRFSQTVDVKETHIWYWDIAPGCGTGDGFACSLEWDEAGDEREDRPDGDKPPPVEPQRQHDWNQPHAD